MPIQTNLSLDNVFALCDSLDESERGFLDERPCNAVPEKRDLFA